MHLLQEYEVVFLSAWFSWVKFDWGHVANCVDLHNCQWFNTGSMVQSWDQLAVVINVASGTQ